MYGFCGISVKHVPRWMPDASMRGVAEPRAAQPSSSTLALSHTLAGSIPNATAASSVTSYSVTPGVSISTVLYNAIVPDNQGGSALWRHLMTYCILNHNPAC